MRLKNFKQYFLAIPTGILSLMFFSTIATILSAIDMVLDNRALHEQVVPHTGWIGMHIYYFALLMTVILITTKNNKVRRTLISLFLYLTAMGAYIMVTSLDQVGHSNPYLRYTYFRPIWEIAIPIMWALVLSSRSSKKFCIDDT